MSTRYEFLARRWKVLPQYSAALNVLAEPLYVYRAALFELIQVNFNVGKARLTCSRTTIQIQESWQ